MRSEALPCSGKALCKVMFSPAASRTVEGTYKLT